MNYNQYQNMDYNGGCAQGCSNDLTGFWVGGFILILIIIIILRCNSININDKPGEPDEHFRSDPYERHGFIMPFYNRRPRMWVTAPETYDGYYSEPMLTCIDSCQGRADRQDCYAYCKQMYPPFTLSQILPDAKDFNMVI